jgi:hypothetical protein
MFSSLSKYLSPKQLLASSLSKSLAEIFDVDPTRIETLLQDAKVVLNDIHLKPRPLSSTLILSGHVEKIEFSWIWDTSAAAFITNVTLTVQGVHLLVRLCKEEEGNLMLQQAISQQATQAQPSSSEVKNSSDGGDWKQKYIQQIIDHLKLYIADVEIIIELEEDASQRVVVQGKSMEIKTLESTATALEQILSVGSIAAWIGNKAVNNDINNNDDESQGRRRPLFDPFGYRATVQRISGRRFLDGIASGLLIQGETRANSAEEAAAAIRVYAGVDQIKAMSRLQDLLLSIGLNESTTTETDDSINKSPEVIGIETSVLSPVAEAVEKIDGKSSLEAGKAGGSRFVLPIESMAVILDNDTQFQLAGCTIRYCMDGSELAVDWSQVWMDDTSLTTRPEEWTLDMIKSELALRAGPATAEEGEDGNDEFQDARSELEKEANEDQASIIRCRLSVDVFRKLYSGIQVILPHVKQMSIGNIDKSEYILSTSSSSSSPWTMKINGTAILRLTGLQGEWIEARLQSPRATYVEGNNMDFPFLLDCQGVDIVRGACSFGDVTLHVPPFQSSTDGTLVVKARIEANLSLPVVEDLQGFWQQISDTFDDGSESKGLPFSLVITQVDLSISGPQSGLVNLFNIQASGLDWKLESMNVQGFDGVTLNASYIKTCFGSQNITVEIQEITCAQARGLDQSILVAKGMALDATTRLASCPGALSIAAKLGLHKASLAIEEISTLQIPGAACLSEPISNTILNFEEDLLKIICPVVNVVCQKSQSQSMAGIQDVLQGGADSMALTESSLVEVPFPIQLLVQSLSMKITEQLDHDVNAGGKEEQLIKCGGLEIRVEPSAPNGAMCHASLVCTDLEGHGPFEGAVAISSLILKAEILQVLGRHLDKSRLKFYFPPFGLLSKATMEVKEIGALNIPNVGILASPMNDLVVRYESNALSIECVSISFIKAASQATGVETKASLELPCAVCVLVQDLVVKVASQGNVEDLLRCHRLNASLAPAFQAYEILLGEGRFGARLLLKCDDITYSNSFRMPAVAATAFIELDRLEELHNLVVEADKAELVADFSNINWSEIFKSSATVQTVKLPFAKVSKLELTLKSQGNTIRIGDASLHCEPFHGRNEADSNALTDHYVNIVKRRVPFLLSKTEILGSNVGDSVGMFAGRAVLHSSVIGSVVGVGARDAVGGALSMGKSSRGAMETEK